MNRDKLLKRNESNSNITPRKTKSSQYIKLLINKIVHLENRLKDEKELINILNQKIAELQIIISELEYNQNIEIVKKLSDLEFKYTEISNNTNTDDSQLATQQLLDMCRDQMMYNTELFNENEKLRDEKIEKIDKKIDESITRKISQMEIEIEKPNQPDDIDFKILEKIADVEAKNEEIYNKLETIEENKVPPLDLKPNKISRRLSTTSNIARPSPIRQNAMKRTKSQTEIKPATRKTTSFREQYKKRIEDQKHPVAKKHSYLKRKT